MSAYSSLSVGSSVDTFTLTEIERPTDRTEVELLQDLFRSLCVPHTLGQQAKEIPAMLDQGRLDGGIQL